MSSEDRGRRTLVLAFDTYGDLVLRQPLLTRLADEGHRLTVAVRSGFHGILPFLEPRARALTTDINPYIRGDDRIWTRVEELRRALVATDPDVVISAPFNRTFLDDALLPSFPGARRYGFRQPTSSPKAGAPPLLTDAVDVKEEIPEVAKNQALADAVSGRAQALPCPRITLGEDTRRAAAHVLAAHGLAPGAFVLGCPAGTSVTALKAWPRDDYVDVALHLHDRHGLPVLLAGVAAEEPWLRAVASAAEARGLRAPVWIGSADTLGLFLGLVASSRLYVGSDSGSMHFAAALGIPVVVRFGGGHWPRFLPSAAQGLVATQQLPCFGCNWECWLDEPACIHGASSQTIREGIDRLLGGASPGLRVETGAAFDGPAGRLIREGAVRHRELAAELRWLRSSLEAEMRASALLQARAQASETDRMAGLDEIQQLARRSREQEAAIDSLRRSVLDLRHQVEYLSTSAAATRVLAGAGLRGIGLFETARRSRDLLRRARPPAGPPAAQAPASTPAPEGERRPSIVEAFVVARSLPGGTQELALERLYHLGARLHSVLCVQPSARNVQAASMLASGGAEVTVLGNPGRVAGLSVPGVTVAGRGLGDWLVSRHGVLGPWDGVLLDAQVSDDDQWLLRGRLPSACMLLVNGTEQATVAGAGPATEQVAGLTLFGRAPAGWRDPVETGYARTLPSGRPWPRISVVTATLNQGAFLEETLRSVLGQGYPDLEYIVVDGGSRDDTPAILDRYRERLAHCVSGPDEGQADALNKGFALASGAILAWLNSDDRYPAGALLRAALAFDAYGADLVAGGCGLVHDTAAGTLGVHHPVLPVGSVVPLPLERLLDLEGSWTKGDFFYQPEVFWTREIWQKAGGRVAKDLHYSMDYELWLRMAGSGARIVHVPDTLAVYRMHPGQKTSGEPLPYLPELRQVASRYRAAHSSP